MCNIQPSGISFNAETFCDIWQSTTIEEAASAARTTYGASAQTAAAWCAITARAEERSGDFRFWLAVFRHLGDQAA